MLSFNGINNKRIICDVVPQEESSERRKKKQKALEWVQNNTDDFFSVRYYIDEEERWMLPHEESDYLDTAHISEMIFPVLFKGLDSNICERCQKDASEHKSQWIIRDNASGHYEFLARICIASGKAFGERVHYNKWSRTQVGESEIVSFAEYYGSEKLTQ